LTVQFALESVSSLPWNHCPDSRGITVQFGLEYADTSKHEPDPPQSQCFRRFASGHTSKHNSAERSRIPQKTSPTRLNLSVFAVLPVGTPLNTIAPSDSAYLKTQARPASIPVFSPFCR